MRTILRDDDRRPKTCVKSLCSLIVLTAFCALSTFPDGATAQESGKFPDSLPSKSLTTLLETRGTLTLRDATLTEALFALREQWNIDMVVADNVEGNVNATFTGASLRQILDSLPDPKAK